MEARRTPVDIARDADIQGFRSLASRRLSGASGLSETPRAEGLLSQVARRRLRALAGC